MPHPLKDRLDQNRDSRRSTPMPKEQPLQRLAPLQLILEPKHIVLIRKLQQIQELRRRLHDGERRRLRMVDKDGDAAVGIKAEEPVFLLVVGHDITEEEEERREKISQVRTSRMGVRAG